MLKYFYKNNMKFYTISLFPNVIESYVNESILGRAIKNKIIEVKNYQLRDFSKDKHRRTDGIPYGGGPGMVMWIDPIINNFEIVLKDILKSNIKKQSISKNILIVNFVPAAEKFTNLFAKEISKNYSHVIFICGRYEGVDARVNEIIKDILNEKKKEIKNKNKNLEKEKKIKFDFEIKDISVGDFVLTGGEIPAMLMIDGISRQVSGVLNDENSVEENRISSSKVYARPEIYEKTFLNKETKKKMIKNYTVPKVLLSGNHKEINAWRENT